MSQLAIEHLREQKNRFFKFDEHSPLSAAQKAAFDGLRYYAYNAELELTIAITPFAHKEDIPVHTTTDEIRSYQRYGQFSFMVGGEIVTLTIYETPHGFFLPFVDASPETYPAGRYIDPEPLGEDRFYIDFNMAYSPYCAYNARFSCPITPAENRLSVTIPAGEKKPTGAWLDAF